jgi:hypothetical protein
MKRWDMKRRDLANLSILFVAFVLRTAWHLHFGTADATPDTAIYVETGSALFATGKMSSFLYMPLYPVAIHLLGISGIVWLQILLSTFTVYLVYLVALAIWNDRNAALVAAGACAVHPVLVYYANAPLTETPFSFLVMAGLLLLYRNRVVFAALVFVLANLTRPTLDLVYPLMFAASALAAEPPRMMLAARRVAIYLAVYVALMSPWWLHNYALYGKFVRLDLAGGITAILENSKSFEAHGFDWTVDPPWEAYGSIADPVERDRAMMTAGIRYIFENPATWLHGAADRFLRFFTPWPAPVTPVRQKWIISILTLPIFACAFASLVIKFRNWRRLLPVVLPVAFVIAVHLATHANMRYRLPIDPLLAVIGAGFLPLLYGYLSGWRAADSDANSPA